MKEATLINIQRFCIHDGPGIRTTVFFKGCPLSCKWCANPASQASETELAYYKTRCVSCGICIELCPQQAIRMHRQQIEIDRKSCDTCGRCVQTCPSNALEILGYAITCQELLEQVEKDAPFYRNSGGGITLSGGEPMMQIDFVVDFLRSCKRNGFHTTIETAGNVPWHYFEKILSDVDLFLFDIKHHDPLKHFELTGVKHSRIFENLKNLSHSRSELIVRVPIIPGFNNSNDDISKLVKRLSTLLGEHLAVEFLPYHALGIHKYEAIGKSYDLNDVKEPSKAEMDQIVALFLDTAYPKPRLCKAVYGI